MDYTHQDHVPSYGIRPKFHVELNYSPQEIASKIAQSLKHKKTDCIGWSNESYAIIGIKKEDQHFWSPQLSLRIETLENTTHLHGRYGPKSSVWTMFTFFYASVAFSLFIITIVGTSRWSLGESSAILWWIPILLIIGLTLFLVSSFGKRLAHDQMLQLHEFLEETLEIEIV